MTFARLVSAALRGGKCGRWPSVGLLDIVLGAVWLLVVRAGRSAALGGDMASVPTVALAGHVWHRLRHGVVVLAGGPGAVLLPLVLLAFVRVG